jgi:hypothetical protein
VWSQAIASPAAIHAAIVSAEMQSTTVHANNAVAAGVGVHGVRNTGTGCTTPSRGAPVHKSHGITSSHDDSTSSTSIGNSNSNLSQITSFN